MIMNDDKIKKQHMSEKIHKLTEMLINAVEERNKHIAELELKINTISHYVILTNTFLVCLTLLVIIYTPVLIFLS